jgi:cystathionine beta-lyase/cystathionine gamma-synthase
VKTGPRCGMPPWPRSGGGAGTLQVVRLAESLGGIESLAGHPWTMSHASVPEERRKAVGITPSLLRLSVGIEDVEDLIDDLEQALAVLK